MKYSNAALFVLALHLTQLPCALAQKIDTKKLEEKLSNEEEKAIKEKFLKSTSDEELAVKLLKLDFAPFLKKLDREIISFNYRDLPNMKLKDGKRHTDTEEAVAYANEWAGAAKKHLPRESGMYGWGFYTASDPATSSSYGYGLGSFGLVTLKYPKGAQMLDLRRVYNRMLPVSDETATLLQKLCPGMGIGSKLSDIPFNKVKKIDFIQNPTCHRIYVKVMEELNISGVIYEWSSEDPKFCDTADNTNAAAFVSINQEISGRNTEFYTNLPADVKKEAKKIQSTTNPKKRARMLEKFSLGEKTFHDYEMMASYISSGYDHHVYKTAFDDFRSPDLKKITDDQEKFKVSSFGCDARYEKADAPTYKPEQVWDVLLQDTLKKDLSKEINRILQDCTIQEEQE